MNSTDESPENSAANLNGRKIRKDWSFKALAIEVASIVVGVLLALGLSEWSEERKHLEQAQIGLDNIASEVRLNHEFLTAIHDNNIATLQAMDGKQVSDADANRNFIPGLQLSETAWETFLTTGLSNYANYDKVLVLSKLYDIQNIYKQTGRQLVAASMTIAAYATVQETEVDNNHFKKQFVGYFELLSDIEAQLLLAYESAIADFDRK
jgi:hypothetical protein